MRGVTALVIFVVVAGAGLLAVPPALAQELQVSTQPSPLYPSFDPSISDYVARCTLGTPTQVSVSPPAGAEVDVDGHGYRTGDFATDVNLQEGQGFTITVRSGSTAKYYVRCLPADFPAWTFQRSGQPQAQWYAVAPFAKTNFGPLPGVSNLYGALFDQNGVPVWWYKTSQQTLDLKLLPNGDFAYAFFNASGIEERRLDGSLVRTLHAGGDAENKPTRTRSCCWMTATTWCSFNGPCSRQTVCGQAASPVSDNGFQVLSPSGTVLFSWWAFDHIPLSEVPSAWCGNVLGQPQGGLLDAYHVNSVEPDGNDFLLSFRHLNAVYKVSGTDGHVVWKLGGTARPGSLPS